MILQIWIHRLEDPPCVSRGDLQQASL
jgi:hypothetical protein